MKKGYSLELCRDGGTLWERVKILDFVKKYPQLKNAKNLDGRLSEELLHLKSSSCF